MGTHLITSNNGHDIFLTSLSPRSVRLSNFHVSVDIFRSDTMLRTSLRQQCFCAFVMIICHPDIPHSWADIFTNLYFKLCLLGLTCTWCRSFGGSSIQQVSEIRQIHRLGFTNISSFHFFQSPSWRFSYPLTVSYIPFLLSFLFIIQIHQPIFPFLHHPCF